jgi:hypothetical protein
MHCEKIYMTKADINTIPAPPSKGISLTGITLSVELISILDLAEVKSTMTLQYKLTLECKYLRLEFRNLKNEMFLNTIGKDDANKIWYPRVVLYNTELMTETKVCANPDDFFFFLFF